jgi:uncharacterized protein YllA (UPF0747 family)
VDDWLTSLAAALQATGPAAERLKAASQHGFVVTAGQQPSLFGGPLYTWWKALSVLAFADALEKATGLPVAPVFWAATDDSDFVEAASTVVATTEGAQRIQLAHIDDPGLPLSRIPLGDVTAQLATLRAAAGSAPHAEILEAVARAYARDETIGSSFVALLREALAPLGVAVLDASHQAVRNAGRAVLHTALERAAEVEAALMTRDAELEQAGFASQVKTVRGRSLVFTFANDRRVRVSIAHARDAERRGDSVELSPNVLLRPIVEQSILPTVAYLGGPAEIAYFAQVGAVADALGTERPLILPRWSGMVVEPRIQKLLDRHSLSPSDFTDPHAVETRLAKESLPPEVQSRIEALQRTVEAEISALAARDHSGLVSARITEGLRRNFLHRVERLERRYTAAIKRRGNEALHDAASVRAALYPFGVPQERALNGVPLLARYGNELFDSVMAETRPHADSLV